MSLYKGVLASLVASVLFVGGVRVGQLLSPSPEGASSELPYVHLQCMSAQGEGTYDAVSIEPLGYMTWRATLATGEVVMLYSDVLSSCLLSKTPSAPQVDEPVTESLTYL